MKKLSNRLVAKLIKLSWKQKLLMLVLAPWLVFGWWVNSDFVYDDYIVIKDESASFDIEGIGQIFGRRHYPFLPYYRPVTRLTFVAQKAIHGDNSALLYHGANILIASGLGVAVYLFLSLELWKIKKPWPLLGALIILLHPVTSSSVYPAASGRETLLPVMLMVLTLYFYLSDKKHAYVGFLVAFFLALFSKEQAVILPVLVGLLEMMKIKRPEESLKKRGLRLIPVLVITGMYLFVRWMIFKGEELEWADNIKLVLATPVYALTQWLWPMIRLHYEPMKIETWFSPLKTGACLGLLGLSVWMGRIWQKPKVKTWFWWLAILVSLLPSANIIKQDAYFSERYILLAGVFLVGFLGQILTKLKTGKREVAAGLSVILIIVMTVVSWHRGKYFENNLVFAREWSQTSPNYYLPFYNLGRSYEEQGNYTEAKRAYEKSLELEPSFAPNYLNLGTLNLKESELIEAEAYFIVYKNLVPNSSKADYHIGLIKLYSEAYQEARDRFEEAMRIEAFPEGYNNLGITYEMLGEFDLARTSYLKALDLAPDFEAARNNLENLEELD